MMISFCCLASVINPALHVQPVSQDQIIASHQNSENKKKMTLRLLHLTCDDKAEQRAQSVSTVCQRRTEEGQ